MELCATKPFCLHNGGSPLPLSVSLFGEYKPFFQEGKQGEERRGKGIPVAQAETLA